MTNRIILIGKGKLLLDGSLNEMKEEFAFQRGLKDVTTEQVVVGFYKEYKI